MNFEQTKRNHAKITKELEKYLGEVFVGNEDDTGKTFYFTSDWHLDNCSVQLGSYKNDMIFIGFYPGGGKPKEFVENKKNLPFWGSTVVKNGMIGKVKITRDTSLFKLNKGKFIQVKKIKGGSEFGVYSNQNGYLGIGNNKFVKAASTNKFLTLPQYTKDNMLSFINKGLSWETGFKDTVKAINRKPDRAVETFYFYNDFGRFNLNQGYQENLSFEYWKDIPIQLHYSWIGSINKHHVEKELDKVLNLFKPYIGPSKKVVDSLRNLVTYAWETDSNSCQFLASQGGIILSCYAKSQTIVELNEFFKSKKDVQFQFINPLNTKLGMGGSVYYKIDIKKYKGKDVNINYQYASYDERHYLKAIFGTRPTKEGFDILAESLVQLGAPFTVGGKPITVEEISNALVKGYKKQSTGLDPTIGIGYTGTLTIYWEKPIQQ